MMLPILVDDEGGDSELLGLVDLLVHDHAILRRVSDVDVAGLPEPWQISSQHYRLAGAADKAVGSRRRVVIVRTTVHRPPSPKRGGSAGTGVVNCRSREKPH